MAVTPGPVNLKRHLTLASGPSGAVLARYHTADMAEPDDESTSESDEDRAAASSDRLRASWLAGVPGICPDDPRPGSPRSRCGLAHPPATSYRVS